MSIFLIFVPILMSVDLFLTEFGFTLAFLVHLIHLVVKVAVPRYIQDGS